MNIKAVCNLLSIPLLAALPTVNKARKIFAPFWRSRAKNRAFRCNSSAPAGLAGFPLQSLAPHGLIADLNLLAVALPRFMLFWRALTHWLGGMGIVVLTVAVFPLLGFGASALLMSLDLWGKKHASFAQGFRYAGSTAGGMKAARILALLKMAGTELKYCLRPRGIFGIYLREGFLL
ncbi:MAG: hypothetical protein LBT33_04670 [Spirochaetia bacterium]|jgi:hypothetical protein|nr:hypothetical protein [Spirochaetia bacterium]